MTREELEELIHFVRQHRSREYPPYEAIVQLADEVAAFREAHAAALSDCDRLRENLSDKCRERDEAMAEIETWKKIAEGRVATRASAIIEDLHLCQAELRDARDERDEAVRQRDRALALLRLWLAARGGGPMLVSDTRALLAEVDG